MFVQEVLAYIVNVFEGGKHCVITLGMCPFREKPQLRQKLNKSTL